MVMEMVSDYWLALLIGLLIGSAITVVGMYLLGFRRVYRGGRTLLVPEIDRRPFLLRWNGFRERFASFELGPRAFTILVGLMALVVVGGLVQNTVFVAEQRRCNREFQRTIAERADIATDDNAARKQQDQAVADLITAFLLIEPGPDSREQSRAALARYLETFRANDTRQQENARLRAENPYPRC